MSMTERVVHRPTAPSWAYRTAALGVHKATRIPGINISISGKENIPRDQNFLLAFTHHNSHDIPALGATIFMELRRHVSFLTKEELLAHKIAGPILNAMHALPISRTNTEDAR